MTTLVLTGGAEITEAKGKKMLDLFNHGWCTHVSEFWGGVGQCYIAYITLKVYSANDDHQCTHPTHMLSVSKVAMKAVILSGTPRSRSGITEYHEVDRPCAKADQVIGMINLIDDGVEGGY